MIEEPDPSEYAPAYAGYLQLVPEKHLVPTLEAQPRELWDLAASVTPEREQHRYAEGKWTVREVLGHVNDVERVFGFRAFCFSRSDTAPLPGFDEGWYVQQSNFQDRPLADLLREFSLLREANLRVFETLDDAGWIRTGVANGSKVSVRALARIMVGHPRHHLRVLRERYGI